MIICASCYFLIGARSQPIYFCYCSSPNGFRQKHFCARPQSYNIVADAETWRAKKAFCNFSHKSFWRSILISSPATCVKRIRTNCETIFNRDLRLFCFALRWFSKGGFGRMVIVKRGWCEKLKSYFKKELLLIGMKVSLVYENCFLIIFSII